MSMIEMAPSVAHTHHSAPYLFALPCGIPGTSEEPVPPHLMRIPPLRKQREIEKLDRMRVFWGLRKAVRYLRTALLKLLHQCTVALEALRSVASPLLPMRGGMMLTRPDVAGLTLGVGEKATQQAVAEEMGTMVWEWTWAPEKTTGVEDLVQAPEKTLEAGGLWGPVGQDADLLERGSRGESPKENDFVCSWDDPLYAAPEPPLSPIESSSVCGHVVADPSCLSSEEESDLSWSEDEEDWDEASAADSRLWESFLHSDDPYNPLGFSALTVTKKADPEIPALCVSQPLLLDRVQRAEEKSGAPQQSKNGNKKVRFSDCVEVRPLVVWEYASRAARNGSCWQEMARDRARFRRRVHSASDIISPFLLPQHRTRVWEKLQLI